MKINDTDIKKIERLAGAWEVRMPDERFFINLPAKVMEEARNEPRSWWTRMAIPAAAAVAAMAVFLAVGSFLAVRETARNNRLARAAVEWSSEDEDWEDIDGLLAEAGKANLSGLHRYFHNSGMEKVDSALDEYAVVAQEDYPLYTE